MTSQKTLFLILSSGALLLALQGVSAAQVCTSNAGCVKGTSCQPAGVVAGTGQGTSGSTGSADATPSGCPKSQPDCGVRAYDATPAAATTATTPEMTCQPVSCTVDADCDAAMVCHAESVTTCSGSGVSTPACPPNQVCPPPPAPEPATCTTTSSSLCAFKWQLPCNVDADCGNAFTCAPSVSGSCGSAAGGATSTSTGSASVGQDAGVAGSGSTPSGSAAPPICTTTTSFPGYCQPRATTCTADSDCPASWICVTIAEVTPISAGAPSTGGSAVGPATGVTSVPAQGVTTPAPAVKVCQPPTWFGVKGGGTLGIPGGQSAPTAGGTTPTRGDSNGATGSTSPTTPESSSGAAKAGGGCAVAGRAELGGSLASFGVLGLLLGVRASRRRRR